MHFHSAILLPLTLFLASSSALSTPTSKKASTSRRGFLLSQVGLTAAAAAWSSAAQPANAYGESEPGAKARKKAAQERKNAAAAATKKPALSGPNVKADDLRGALGDFASYGGASPAKK